MLPSNSSCNATRRRSSQCLQSILAGATKFNAVDTFKFEYRRAALARRINETLQGFAALIVPTTPTIYTIAQVLDDPIRAQLPVGHLHQLHQSR